MDIKDSWAHKIKQGPIKISNGPLKFGNMGYGALAHFKGPSSFWARINPDRANPNYHFCSALPRPGDGQVVAIT